MTMQQEKGRGLAKNFWAQMAIMAVVIVVVIVLAVKFVF